MEGKFKLSKKTKNLPSSKSIRKTIKKKNISHNEKIIHIRAYTNILQAYHNKTRNKNKKKALIAKILKYKKKIVDLQNVMKMYPNSLHKNQLNSNEYDPKEKAQELRNKIQQFKEYKKNRDYKLSKTKNRVITILKSNKRKKQHQLINQVTTANIQKELEVFYLKHPQFRPNTYHQQEEYNNDNLNE